MASKKIRLSSLALKHMSHAAKCGLPNEEWVSLELEDGTVTPKHCPRCAVLKPRRCLTCDEIFEPGCRLRYTCTACYIINSSKHDHCAPREKKY